jgi:hypothetical protein
MQMIKSQSGHRADAPTQEAPAMFGAQADLLHAVTSTSTDLEAPLEIQIDRDPPTSEAIQAAQLSLLRWALGLLAFTCICIVAYAFAFGPRPVSLIASLAGSLACLLLANSGRDKYQVISAERCQIVLDWQLRSPRVREYVAKVSAQKRELMWCEFVELERAVQQDETDKVKASLYGPSSGQPL